jgi:hypothetical protein
MLQELFEDARQWLSRAEQIASAVGEAQVAREARRYLEGLQELSEASPSASSQ